MHRNDHHPGPPRRLGRQRAHLHVKGGDLLLIGGRGQKIAHLGLERVIHLDIDVVTGCLLLVVRVHAMGSTQEGMGEHTAASILPTWARPARRWGARSQTSCFGFSSQRYMALGRACRFPSSHLPNDMVDDNGVWMLQQPSQLHGNLGETEPATAEDLERVPKMPLRAQEEEIIPGPV